MTITYWMSRVILSVLNFKDMIKVLSGYGLCVLRVAGCVCCGLRVAGCGGQKRRAWSRAHSVIIGASSADGLKSGQSDGKKNFLDSY